LGERGSISEETEDVLRQFAAHCEKPVFLAQLACTLHKFPERAARLTLYELMNNYACRSDPQMPLLIWWALERLMSREENGVIEPIAEQGTNFPIHRFVAERWAMRLVSSNGEGHRKSLSSALDSNEEWDLTPVLEGIRKALEAGFRDGPWDDKTSFQLKKRWKADRTDARLLEIMGRLKDPEALEVLRNQAASTQLAPDKQLKAVRILGQVRDPKAKELFLKQFSTTKSDSAKVAYLTALEAFDDPAIGAKLLAGYVSYSPAVKKRALQALLTRPSWALALVQQLDKGTFPKNDFTLTQAKTAVLLNDNAVTAIVEKHFGKLAPATPGEKQA